MKLNEIKNSASEELASAQHDSWARWMKYLFSKSIKNPDGSVLIPKKSVDMWKRQMETDYNDLTKSEKDSDREEVKKQIKIINKYGDDIFS